MQLFRCTRRLLSLAQPDPTLVSLPAGVEGCKVFRNVLSSHDEHMIWEEMTPVLQREGQEQIADNSTPSNRIVKSTYLEMFGNQEFTEVKSATKREMKRLPGLVWSPTLMRLMERIAPPLLGGMPDMARVIEHNSPGYEMHVEQPTVGSAFLYLSLLSDTVLSLDDEGTSRSGQVLLPQRSLMVCSHEVRWGWRFGEHPAEVHVYRGNNGLRREVWTDLRLSIQLWRFTPSLLDHRDLQKRLEESIVAEEKKRIEQEEQKRRAAANKESSTSSYSGSSMSDEELKQSSPAELLGLKSPLAAAGGQFASDTNNKNEGGALVDEPLFSPSPKSPATKTAGGGKDADLLKSAIAKAKNQRPSIPQTPPNASDADGAVHLDLQDASGTGTLGGDLAPPEGGDEGGQSRIKKMEDVQKNYVQHKVQFENIHNVLREMKERQDGGQPVNDMWLKKKVQEQASEDPERDKAEGFDPNDIEGTWDRADSMARFYKTKLRGMDYDGTAFANSSMPDVTVDKPLDMRATIRKMVPHVKDGDKILAALPGGDRIN